MTGYGRAVKEFGTTRITAEIRSVNHRFADISIKTPRMCGFLDLPLKNIVAQAVSRGKIDVSISVEDTDGGSGQIAINRAAAEKYLKEAAALQKELNVPGKIEITDLIKLPEVIVCKKDEQDQSELTENAAQTLKAALEGFCGMRGVEGRRLGQAIAEQLDRIDVLAAEIAERAPLVAEEYRQKLTARMSEILEEIEPDEQKILAEAAFFADRACIDEELVRIKSHTAQMRAELQNSAEAIGKKLDFITQELNREANTIGSKANDGQITKAVIQLKAEIEKIREQVQNIE